MSKKPRRAPPRRDELRGPARAGTPRPALAWFLVVATLAAAAWLLTIPTRWPSPSRPQGPLPPATKVAAKRILHEVAPVALAGEPYTVDLMDPPAPTYAAVGPSGADASYAALVAGLRRPGVLYDAALSRAARELAMQQSLLGGLVPQDIVDFLLRGAGAVDRTVVQSYTATSGDGTEAARQRVEDMLARDPAPGPVRIGIGEVWIPGAAQSRIVGILLSRREVEVSASPRRVETGETWSLSGVLPRGDQEPSALVLRPDGQLEEVPVRTVDRRFQLDVQAGETVGTLVVNVGATGHLGHTTLLQVPVEVGQPLPATYATHLPPDESRVRTAEAAEPIAFALLNADRARFGLPALVRDARLDAVARAHSVDMRDHGFFGHRSPTTGNPQDRVAAAGYLATITAENIATEQSVHAAEANLFASLGHRRNILNADVTHVGIGVAAQATAGRVEWHVTQLFALPARGE